MAVIQKHLKCKKAGRKAPDRENQDDQQVPKKGKALGQAPALPLKMWKAWLRWLLDTAGPKVFFVVFLTSVFGLRCGEA